MSPLALFSKAPVWIWPLFVFLLFVGLRASRKRQARVEIYWAMPFLGLIPLSSVLQSPSPFLALSCFLPALALGAAWGARYQKRILISRSGPLLALRGEWATMTAMLAIFWMNFAHGFLQDVAPHLLEKLWLSLSFQAFGGLLAGQFIGRAFSTLRMPDSMRQKA